MRALIAAAAIAAALATANPAHAIQTQASSAAPQDDAAAILYDIATDAAIDRLLIDYPGASYRAGAWWHPTEAGVIVALAASEDSMPRRWAS